MSEHKCPECGSEIVVDYITPRKTYEIIERKDGKTIFKRSDQNSTFYPDGDNPYLVFRCEEDLLHDIETEEIKIWVDRIEIDFYEGHYHER